jgi:DNA polymerase-3 subunit delta
LLANGIHALAILATLRNHIKKMLLISCAQQSEQPLYKTDIPYPAFQNKYLPALKEGREDWSSLWVSHPYGLFVLFRQTAKFSSIGLQRCLEAVLTAEYRLKGSPIPARLVLEDLLISFMRHSTSEMDAS